jgi:anti-sigma B factor antagonist
METAIGVFASRDRAEEAIKELRHHVPDESIVFLTRSENEAVQAGREFGAVVGGIAGGATGLYAGIVASLLVPGLGPVFALGAGAAALLGLAAAGTGAALGKNIAQDQRAPEPTAEEKCSEDVAFFREVLKEGRSLVVVRTEVKEIATAACAILDRLGLAMRERTPIRMQTSTRIVDGIAFLAISGRITLGEGNVVLRDLVRQLMDQGNKKIVLNLSEVDYIDSSGIGELVKAHTTVRNQDGRLRLTNLSRRVNDLLQMTKLSAVFDVDRDEATAVRSMQNETPSRAVA